MKKMDLMYAMTELDDELLNRWSAAKLKRFRFSRIATFAAVLALVTMIVYSAMLGIDYWFGYDGDGYYTIDYHYSMETAVIHQAAYEDMAEALVDNHIYYQNRIECEDYTQPDTQSLEYSDALDQAWLFSLGQELNSLEEVEDYLGVDFHVSPEIRDAVNSSFQFRSETNIPVFVTAYGPCYQDAAAEFRNTGTVTPLGVKVELSFLDEEQKNWNVGLRVYIALTEDFAEQFRPDTWYSPEGSGQYRVRDYSNGSQEFMIANSEYSEEYGGVCLALYEDSGVGYELYCCTWPTDFEKSQIGKNTLAQILGSWYFDGRICTDSEEIVLPLIKGIK